jgi:hypothetical protein
VAAIAPAGAAASAARVSAPAARSSVAAPVRTVSWSDPGSEGTEATPIAGSSVATGSSALTSSTEPSVSGRPSGPDGAGVAPADIGSGAEAGSAAEPDSGV